MAVYGEDKYGVGVYGPGSSGIGGLSEAASSSPVKIENRGYVIDLAKFERRPSFSPRGILDFNGKTLDQAFPSDSRWHRIRNDWTGGAGQIYADRESSDSTRYKNSYAVDTLRSKSVEEQELELRSEPLSAMNHTGIVAVSNFASYAAALEWNGTTVYIKYGALGSSELAQSEGNWLMQDKPTHLASDGTTLYFGDNSGVRLYNETSGSSLHPAAPKPDMIGWAHGRLICSAASEKNKLYELGASTSTLFATHPNTDLVWSSPIAAPNGIYLIGSDQWRTSIYKIDVESTDGSLRAPYQVAELPPGEKATVLYYYAGMILISTSSGVRVATIGRSGFLTYGPPIPSTVGTSPGGMAGNGPFVYVVCGSLSYTPLEGSAVYGGGVIRLDMREFVEPLVPISEIYAILSGYGGDNLPIPGISFLGNDMFLIHVNTLYQSNPAVSFTAATGWVNLGVFDFGRPTRDKTLTNVKVITSDMDTGVSGETNTLKVRVKDDAGTVTTLATHTSGDEVDQTVSVTSKTFEVELELATSAGENVGFSVKGVELEAIAEAAFGETIVLPVLLHDRVEAHAGGQDITYNAWDEYKILRDYAADRKLVTVEIGEQTLKGYIQGIVQEQESVHAWMQRGQTEFLQGTYNVIFEAVEDATT